MATLSSALKFEIGSDDDCDDIIRALPNLPTVEIDLDAPELTLDTDNEYLQPLYDLGYKVYAHPDEILYLVK